MPASEPLDQQELAAPLPGISGILDDMLAAHHPADDIFGAAKAQAALLLPGGLLVSDLLLSDTVPLLAPPPPPTPPEVRYCQEDGAECCLPSGNATCPACDPAAEAAGRLRGWTSLWGCKGELFASAGTGRAGRLYDWSWAGFAGGDAPLPALAVAADVRADFGAVGDGVADDSQAFLDAVASVKDRAVLFISEGIYRITKQITIPSRIVLRGAGRNRTTLLFPQPLSAVYGLKERPGGATEYTRGRAWIQFEGIDRWFEDQYHLASVTRDASRGDTRLWLDTVSAITPGQLLLFTLDNPPDGSLQAAMAGGHLDGRDGLERQPAEEGMVRFVARATAVDAAARAIEIDRPLPLDARLGWRPRVSTTGGFRRTLCGVEHLTMALPHSPWKGLGHEKGYNLLGFASVQNSWVQDVGFRNADLALVLRDCSHFTIKDVALTVDKSRSASGVSGTRGIWVHNSREVLLTGFDFSTRFWTDVSVTRMSTGVVVTNGKGVDLSVGTENSGPYGLLINQVDFGKASSPWRGRSFATGGLLTLWNCRASSAPDAALPPPLPLFGPALSAGGLRLRGAAGAPDYLGWLLDATSLTVPAQPEDLFSAVRAASTRARVWNPAAEWGANLVDPASPSAGCGAGLDGAATQLEPGYGCSSGGDKCCYPGGRVPVGATCPACDDGYLLPSQLYGCAGELWKPNGRLPDWSFAGYMAGESPLPWPEDLPVVADLKLDFGAVGDGVADDTDAFLAALNTVEVPKAKAGAAVHRAAPHAAPQPALRQPPPQASKAKEEAAAPAAVAEAGPRLWDGPQEPENAGLSWAPAVEYLDVGRLAANDEADPSQDQGAAREEAYHDAKERAAGRGSGSGRGSSGGDVGVGSGGVEVRDATAALAASLLRIQGSRAAARHVAWSLDPTYTLLLDPAEAAAATARGQRLPGLPGMLVDTPLARMGADQGAAGGFSQEEEAGGDPDAQVEPVLKAADRGSDGSGSVTSLLAERSRRRRLREGRHAAGAKRAPSSEPLPPALDPPMFEATRSGCALVAPDLGGTVRPALVGSDGTGGADMDTTAHARARRLSEFRIPDPASAAFKLFSSFASAATHAAARATEQAVSADAPAPPPSPSPRTPRRTRPPVVEKGVLFIPEGTYVLKRKLDIRRQGLVIRGAGVNKTTIYIPVSLTDAYGNDWGEGGSQGVSQYSHSAGFINFFGWDPMGPWNALANVTRPAKRGDTRLYVDRAAAMAPKVGQWVRFVMDGDLKGLLTDMNDGFMGPGPGQLTSNAMGKAYRLLTRVTAVGPDYVDIERPLTANASLRWAPRFHAFQPQISGNGIEHLTIQFKWDTYKGHLKEDGYNALHFNQLANSWVRNVRIVDADAGIYFWGAQHCTVTDLEISYTKPRYAPACACGRQNGHRGVWMERGSDNLLTRFRVGSPLVHDVTLSWTEMHTVISEGWGTDLNVDHHRNSPYANLITALNHGRGGRPWESSGAGSYGAHAAALTTFWGSTAQLGFYYPPPDGTKRSPGMFGPTINFLWKSHDSMPSVYNWWSEPLLPRLWPRNLHDAMQRSRKTRLAAAAAVAAAADGRG